jgi:hypothetical protein
MTDVMSTKAEVSLSSLLHCAGVSRARGNTDQSSIKRLYFSVRFAVMG